jgi:nucleoside-diphosphate-sugar epimerase
MDVSKMKSHGFEPIISLDKGIDQVIESYKKQIL